MVAGSNPATRTIQASSNGRTRGFDPCNRGSNPCAWSNIGLTRPFILVLSPHRADSSTRRAPALQAEDTGAAPVRSTKYRANEMNVEKKIVDGMVAVLY